MENMQNSMGGGKMVCACPHHKVFPILIILLGLVFLLEALSILTPGFVAIVWPIIVIVAGGMKLMGKKCKCC